jgi:hypothetical protein
MDFSAVGGVEIKQGNAPKPKIDFSSVGGVPVNSETDSPSKSVSGFISNVPRSAGNAVKNVAVGAVALPGQATEQVGGTAKDILTGDYKGLFKRFGKLADNAVALQKEMVNRYGSLDKAKETAYNDPVGFAMDLSTVLTGAGGAVKALGAAGKLEGVAKAGSTIAKAGEIANPLTAVPKATSAFIKNKTLAPFGKSVDKEVVRASQETGVTLPASAISKSPTAKIAESVAAKSPLGGDIVQRIENANNQIIRIADETVAKTGRIPDLNTAGRAISDGMNRFEKVWQAQKHQLYKTAFIGEGRPGNPVIKVMPSKTITTLDKFVADLDSAEKIVPKAEYSDFFKGMLDNISKAQSTDGTINGKYMQSAIRQIGRKMQNFNDPVSTGSKAELKAVFAAMSDDLDSAIKSQRPELAEAIDNANAFYQEGLNKLNSEWGKKITKLAESGDYSKIAPAIMNSATPLEAIPKIYEVIGQDNVPQVQAVFLRKLFNDAKNPTTGNFYPAKLSAEIYKYGDDKLRAILSPKQYDSLKNVATLTKSMASGQKILEGSQTAFLSNFLVQLGGLFVKPLAALRYIIGDASFNKFIASESGQKLLTSGIPLRGASKAISRAASRANIATNAAYQTGKPSMAETLSQVDIMGRR